MWRTPTGDRTLDLAEWAVFLEGLVLLWDLIEDEGRGANNLSHTAVAAFDELQPGQKLYVLAEVGRALSDPNVPAPFHTAANEAAVAAVFAAVEIYLDLELDNPAAQTYLRELILAAVGASDDELPAVTATAAEPWRILLETLMFRVLWDVDFTQGDDFLDLPPDVARRHLAHFGVDPEYYTFVPPDPDDAGLVPVRQTLARLAGRPVMDEYGTYPALEDRYHDLVVGPCDPEVQGAYLRHPWIEPIGLPEPRFDCDLATWARQFAPFVPTEPFALDPGRGAVGPTDHVRVDRRGNGWVVRDHDGRYWCELVGNGWTDRPADEFQPALAFPSVAEARAARSQAEEMYAERHRRGEEARRAIQAGRARE
ncbi:MAG TPA: hypothetical protein VM597_19105 [Gemmataceae bacterium]|nr:hypothetical protein [Gemmataceae bacterium]